MGEIMKMWDLALKSEPRETLTRLPLQQTGLDREPLAAALPLISSLPLFCQQHYRTRHLQSTEQQIALWLLFEDQFEDRSSQRSRSNELISVDLDSILCLAR